MTIDWEERRRELEAARLARLGQQDNVVQLPVKQAAPDEELPPELAEAVPTAELTEEDKEDVAEHIQSADQRIASLVEGIGILQAYDMWIGKMKPSPSPGNPEVFVSCPLPGHEDKNPSACANTDTNLWMCYRCQQGGDVLDLAAIRYDMPDYKTGQNFHNLYRKIAENDFGWSFSNEGGFQVGLSPEDQVKKANAAQKEFQEEYARLKQREQGELPPNNVIDLATGEEYEDEDDDFDPHFGDPFQIDWRPLVSVPSGVSFLEAYMNACTVDFAPEEFHLWNGLLALGLATGKSVKFDDGPSPLYPNLFICHMAGTSEGKSMSTSWLKNLLKNALPFDQAAPDRKGVNVLTTGQSGEYIIQQFKGDYKQTGKNPPIVPLNHKSGHIKGLISYNELTALLARRERNGAVIQETLLEFYDCDPAVGYGSVTGGTHIAEHPFGSLVTSTQPARLRTQLTKDDAYSGFINRFIFTAGPLKNRPSRGGRRVDTSHAEMMLKAVHEWATIGGGRSIYWHPNEDDPAGILWDRFYEDKIRNIYRSGSETVKRIEVTMRKLVMLFCINEMTEVVTESAVSNAISLWDYLVGTYKAIDDSVMLSRQSQMEDDILETIRNFHRKGKDKVTFNMVRQNRKSKYSREEMLRTIRNLMATGEIDEIQVPTTSKGGRKPDLAFKARRFA